MKYEIYNDPGGILSGGKIVVGFKKRWWWPVKVVAEFPYDFCRTGAASEALAKAQAWIAAAPKTEEGKS